MQHIKSIAIVGGGTSGWLTAAYLLKNLSTPVKIILIESTKIGPVGVGEGTQPYTSTFLRKCGFTPDQWMKNADATFKYGVEFSDWQTQKFFVDNDSLKTHVVSRNKLSHQYWVGKKIQDYFSWLPTYRLAQSNISPRLDEELDFVVGNENTPAEALHFNAFKIGESIKNLIIDKIVYHDSEITKVIESDQGIDRLILSNELEITSDLYIDCTGFKSMLLEETLKENHVYINDLLPCDRAVTIPTQYRDPPSECHPYTKSIAMSSGWRWAIPTFGRIGNGYVYSSKYISDSDAEQELRRSIGEFNEPAVHLKMKCGFKRKIAIKNVVAVGLSAGFVEPLEATGITFTTKIVEILCNFLNDFENNLNDNVRLNLNNFFTTMVHEIISFVFLHYKTSSKRDTEFWKNIDNITVPNWISNTESLFKSRPPNELRKFGIYDMFHSGQWFQLLASSKMYETVQTNLTDKETIYYEIHNEMLKTRTDLQINNYPNHYEYLEKIYKDH